MQSLLAAVSLRRIAENAKAVQRIAKKPLLAVVKDDAYGHGAIHVSLALEPFVSGFAVATVNEGAALRLGGVQKEILVLTPPLCREEGLRAEAYSLLSTLDSAATLHFGVKRVHLAVNTGMNRYGVRPSRVGQLLKRAQEEGVLVEGVYSHLFDPSDGGAAEKQAAYFAEAAARVKESFPAAKSHLSATGGLLLPIEADLVRCGLALYGYSQSGLPVRPAMKIYAAVSSARTAFGEGIGYARANRPYSALHTLRLGYGDGFFREGGLSAVGKLCMDACVREGRGTAGTRRLILRDFEAYAREHNTSVYEVLVNVARKAERKYQR